MDTGFDYEAAKAEARAQRPADGTVRGPLPWADLAAFLSESEPEALIARWLPRDAWVLLYGREKTFKSFVAIDMQMSMAGGREFQGCPTEIGDVVYLSGEGNAGVRKRLNAWLKHNKLPLQALCGRFHLLPCPLRMDDRGTVDRLIEDIGARLDGRPLLSFAVDTMSRYCGADQNSSNEMHTGFIDPVSRIMGAFPGATAICIHHAGKTEDRGARGSNALSAAADVILKTTRSDSARPNFTLEMEFAKDWESPEPMSLRLERVALGCDADGNDTITSGVIIADERAPIAAAAKQSKLGAPEKVALEALADLIARQGKQPPADSHIPANRPCVTEKAWRDHAIGRGLSDSDDTENQKRAFRRTRTKLVAAGKVGNWQEFSWLT